ncbi:MAG: flippase-like domain-containing protein [Myxococcota bacterium]|nr:flippase-like domain-containing protein [Myxococcota bacterium]
MKLAVNLVLSLGMLALCAWLVWPNHDTREQLRGVIEGLSFAELWPYLVTYLGLLVVVQLCRALRWNNLLAPLGVRIPTGPLLAISSVGFMAILALPARLGELVRPGLLRRRGDLSASAALGTVAVERVVDGLLVSLFVFGALFAMRGPDAPSWMMPTAYVALGVFAAALVFVVFATRRPEATVAFCMKISLLPKLAPRIARVIETKLLEMVRAFVVIRDVRNMTIFVVWSTVYWVANGLGVYVLARGFGLDLSVMGAFATMGVCAVGIMLPNSPGLVGQFQYFTLLGVGLYLGFDARLDQSVQPQVYFTAYAFANVHYLMQVSWYVLCGALGLASPWVSFSDLRHARHDATAAASPEEAARADDDRQKLAPPAMESDARTDREEDALAPR